MNANNNGVLVEKPITGISISVLFGEIKQARQVIIVEDNSSDLGGIVTKVKKINPGVKVSIAVNLQEAIAKVRNADLGTIVLCDDRFPIQPNHFEEEPNAMEVYNAIQNPVMRFVLLASTDQPQPEYEQLATNTLLKSAFIELDTSASTGTSVSTPATGRGRARAIERERDSCHALLTEYGKKGEIGKGIGKALVRLSDNRAEIREGAADGFAQYFIEQKDPKVNGPATIISLLRRAINDVHIWNGVHSGISAATESDPGGTNKSRKALAKAMRTLFDKDKGREIDPNIKLVYRSIFESLGGIRGTIGGQIDQRSQFPSLPPSPGESRFMRFVRRIFHIGTNHKRGVPVTSK